MDSIDTAKDELQSYWEVASITHFCHLFRSKLKLPPFEFEDLEEAILEPISAEGDESGRWLIEKIIKSLLGGYFGHSVNETNYDRYFRKIMATEWEQKDNLKNPLMNVTFDENGEERIEWLDFHSLNTRTKVQVLFKLCDYRLGAADSSTFVKDASGRLRLKPIGTDSLGYVYWYFHGRRLYKEKPRVAKILVEKLREPMKQVNGPSSPVKEEVIEITEEKESKVLSPQVPEEPETPKVPKSPMNDHSSNGLNKTMASGLKNQTTLLNWIKTRQSKPEPKSASGIPVSILKESWSVVCHDEDGWRKTIERLKQSLSLPDRELAERFKLTYLPKVIEIEAEILKRQRAEEKQRELIAKANMPRRCSARVASKLASQQLSVENIIENKVRSRADRARLRDLYRNGCDEETPEDTKDESFNPKDGEDKDSYHGSDDEEEELEPNDEDDLEDEEAEEDESIEDKPIKNLKDHDTRLVKNVNETPTPSVSSGSVASLSSNDREGSVSSTDSRYLRRSNRKHHKPNPDPPSTTTTSKRIRVNF